MSGPHVVWSGAQAGAIRSQLAKLLGSSALRAAPRQQRLLRHLVEATLSGDGDRLKGYVLGVEVFDRGADFDPGSDPLVRVEVGRLRGKLLAYYSAEGSHDAVLIDVPKGAYAARFTFRGPGHAHAGWLPQRSLQPQQERPRIAVLPFTNFSTEVEQEHFADGITEDLLTDLSKLSGLFVISRHSVFAYRGSRLRVEEIARELSVRYVLEGSVRRAGETMRINAQLVDAESGVHLWAERYDRPLRDLFEVQDDVTRHIVRALAVRLTRLEDALIGRVGTGNLDVRDLVQRGIGRYWLSLPEGLAQAQALFGEAVLLDPEYAAAHAWLALAAVTRHSAALDRTNALLGVAQEHVRIALSLDALLPLVHAAACHVEDWSRNPERAIEAGRRAVALDPNYADGHAVLANALTACNRGHEALAEIEIAMRLNPRPLGYFYRVWGLSLELVGRYDEAMAVFRQGIQAWPGHVWNRVALAHRCMRSGLEDEARQLMASFREAFPDGELVFRNSFSDQELRRRQSIAMRRLGFTEVE